MGNDRKSYVLLGGENNDSDGREIDGLGITAQRKGAKAVVATLWVDDASVSNCKCFCASSASMLARIARAAWRPRVAILIQ